MKNFNSRFSYNKRQRNGIFFLILFIIVLQIIFFYSDFTTNNSATESDSVIVAFRHERDSLEAVELEGEKPKMFPFNPSFITDYKGYQLGMSTDEIDRLHTFRKNGNYINSIKQFQKVTNY